MLVTTPTLAGNFHLTEVLILVTTPTLAGQIKTKNEINSSPSFGRFQ
jgi:hypothetical protein